MSRIYTRRDVLRLGLSAGALGLVGCGDEAAFGFGGHDAPVTPRSDAADFRALVCVFLLGGNDGYNTVVPITPEKREPYERARLDLALPASALVGLAGTAPDGARYGMPQAAAVLAQRFNRGRLAVIGNVGPLAAPVTRADYQAGRNLPARLFSHNDQQDQWHSAQAGGAAADGWGGRAAEVLEPERDGTLPFNVTLAGPNLLQRAARSAPFAIAPSGPARLDWLPPESSLRTTYDRLRALPREHLLEQAYVEVHERALRLNRRVETALASVPAPGTAFPATGLGAQLRMVARLVGARAQLGLRRQVFYVALGGFDTHDGQHDRHPALLRELSEALAAFDDAMLELGASESVTAFTASDFGRSLTVNGKGTDHGWSSHQLVLGGAVRGGAFYGGMPSLVPDADDDTRGGRFIPSLSVDEYAATLVRWLGVSDADLSHVLPNLGRFATRGPGFL